MKKLFSFLLFIFLINCSYGQDITTLIKLHDISASLGSSGNTSIDTVLLKARAGITNFKVAEQLLNLLRAAEYYSNKDYENSGYYIKKVVINFKYAEYNNLKFLLLIGNYANLKDINNTAKYFYIINKTILIDPENIRTIRREIRNNFNKDDFNDALSQYYYYHKRLRYIDEIGFSR